jgi:hypothetical protein
MILDSSLQFSAAQQLLTNAASDNIVDLLNARDLGVGDSPAVQVIASVNTAFVTTNSGTLQVQFQGSTDSSTWTTYAETPAVAAANLAATRQLAGFDVPRPVSGAALPRYYRLNYVVGTGTFTAGKVDAWLGIGRSDQVQYPKNYDSSYATP